MTGFKTFLAGLTRAVLPQAIGFVSSFDFVGVLGLSPNAASVIGAGMIALRAVTTTPIFKPS